jgi:hypothetical protein
MQGSDDVVMLDYHDEPSNKEAEMRILDPASPSILFLTNDVSRERILSSSH